MTQLSNAVQEAIKGNLPGLVAAELKDYIDQAEKNAIALEKAENRASSWERDANQYRRELAMHVDLDSRKRELQLEEKRLSEMELKLLKQEAALEAKVTKAELSGVKETMVMFLKNSVVRQTVVADVAKPVEGYPGNQYNSGCSGTLQRSVDTTTTTKEVE